MGEWFLDDVRQELEDAREKHPKRLNSYHEGYAVILEEMREFWDEARKQSACRDEDAMYGELVQLAAMAMRTAEDCGLVDYQKKLYQNRARVIQSASRD